MPGSHEGLFNADERTSLRKAWPLDYSVAHLNHGSFGAMPTEVIDVQSEWRARVQANPVGFYRRDAWPAVESALEQIAAFLDADVDGLAFVDNATTAMTTVLCSVPLRPGDEILLTDHTYGAVRMAAERFAADAGARVTTVAVPLAAQASDWVDRVVTAVTPATRLAIIDQVTSPTARLLPVAELAAELHQRGVELAVDGAHAPGMLDLSIRSLGVDYWFGNLHKWLCGPTGAAVLAVAADHRGAIRSPIVSWQDGSGFPDSIHHRGTRDLTPWLGAPAAVAFHARVGWDRTRAYGRALAADAVDRVVDALGIDPAGVPAEDLPMRVVPLPERLSSDRDIAGRLQDQLSEQHSTESVLTAWQGRLLLRLSAHLYNESADYDRLIGALSAFVRQPAAVR